MMDTRVTRRAWLASSATLAWTTRLGFFPTRVARASAPVRLTVYKDPSCRCCTKWVAHLRVNGLAPEVHDRSDMDGLKDSLGVPATLRSCHTAVVGRYLIEGHVPARDVKRLLSSAPRDVLGLAVPGMPSGSPGMEMGGRGDRYSVVAFGPTRKPYIFANYG